MANPLAGPSALLNIRECIVERNSTFIINDERPLFKVYTSENPTEFMLECDIKVVKNVGKHVIENEI